MKPKWLINVAAYTLAGVIASALVGGTLGLLGRAFVPREAVLPGMLLAIAVGLLAIARALGVTAIPLPQLARQTRDVWAKTTSSTVAAIRWGLDLGLVYTTWFTFPGVWLLTLVAIVVREPGFGAASFMAYWLGRTLSVWLGPSMMERPRDTPKLFAAVHGQYPLFQRTHVAAVTMAVVVLIISVAGGSTL
jgi:hypothetical protein